jgi:predicted enzyme related to lactoylglutathione lyase
MFQQMSWLGLVVEDVAAATEFYSQKLGLPLDEAESMPGVYTQFKLNGGAMLGLIKGFEREDVDQAFDTAFVTPDVDAAYEQLQAAGVDLVDEPHDMPFGRTFLFRTPDGHVLRVLKPPAAS